MRDFLSPSILVLFLQINRREIYICIFSVFKTATMSFKGLIITGLILISSSSVLAQESSFTWYFEGNKQLFKKNYDLAIEAYNKAIELDKNADYAWFNRGNAKFEQKLYKEARLDYNKTILLNAEYAEAYHGRGMCKIFTGDTEGGCKDLKTSKNMDFKPSRYAMDDHCK